VGESGLISYLFKVSRLTIGEMRTFDILPTFLERLIALKGEIGICGKLAFDIGLVALLHEVALCFHDDHNFYPRESDPLYLNYIIYSIQPKVFTVIRTWHKLELVKTLKMTRDLENSVECIRNRGVR
jgi:hypothetical protein